MRCPVCRSVRSDLVDMAPGRDPAVLSCPNCPATLVLRDLGYLPAIFTPLPGPALTPQNETICRWCSAGFVASRGAHYCSEPCRFQARQAARKAYHVTPDVKQRSERTTRILAKVESALASAGVAADQGWRR